MPNQLRTTPLGPGPGFEFPGGVIGSPR